MIVVLQLFLCFILYSMVGWVYETILCSIIQGRLVSRGFLFGPLCPIYGFGALAVIILLNGRSNPFGIFVIGATTACAVEYLTSLLMEKLFHARWWDYSDKFMNINGRVCLTGFLIFGAFSVIVVLFVQPVVWKMITSLSEFTLLVGGGMILGIFIMDVIITVFYALKLTKHLDTILLKINERVETSSIHEFATRVKYENEEFSKYVEANKDNLTIYHLVKFLRAFPDIKYREGEQFSEIMHKYADQKKGKDEENLEN